MQQENIINLNIDLITPNPNQPRKYFDENSLNELALSIKEYGILNPILVRNYNDNYEIIAGERRYRAAKIAGLKEVPVIVKNVDTQKMAEIAVIENIQRENINSIEEAKSYKKILDNENITEKELSNLIGKSQPFIANKIRLLKLPDEIQTALINKKISEKHARSLLTIDDIEKQIEVLNTIIDKKLSVRELNELIQQEKLNNKKEEKESDNMNNESFFPNLNNQINNNNMSLNSMNMQSMSNSQPNFTDNSIQSPMSSVPNFQSTPSVPQFNEPSTPNQNINSVNNANNNFEQPVSAINPIPTFNTSTGTNLSENIVDTQPLNNSINISTPSNEFVESSSPVVDIPLFSEQNYAQATSSFSEQPVIEPANSNTQSFEPIPQFETPLFNQELNNSAGVQPSNSETTNLNESFYDVPVNISPVIEQTNKDKVQQIEQLLSSNGIEYKKYNNETSYCIIIEL